MILSTAVELQRNCCVGSNNSGYCCCDSDSDKSLRKLQYMGNLHFAVPEKHAIMAYRCV